MLFGTIFILQFLFFFFFCCLQFTFLYFTKCHFFLWFLFSWVHFLSTFCCCSILSSHHNYFPISFTISNTIIFWFNFFYFYFCPSVITFNSSSSLELFPIHYFFQGIWIYNIKIVLYSESFHTCPSPHMWAKLNNSSSSKCRTALNGICIYIHFVINFVNIILQKII